MELMIEGKKVGPAALVASQTKPARQKRSAMTDRGAVGWAAAWLVLFVAVLALWAHPEWRRHDLPDWRPLVERGDAAAAGDDRYAARHLYVDAARAASSAEDWKGLLVAACGMKKIDGMARAHANTHFILVRAMAIVETRRSRSGVEQVARAFSAVGEKEVAEALLARVKPEWPHAADAHDAAAADCWS
jgi:hypothetical protein